jgi:hypothetical protein
MEISHNTFSPFEAVKVISLPDKFKYPVLIMSAKRLSVTSSSITGSWTVISWHPV